MCGEYLEHHAQHLRFIAPRKVEKCRCGRCTAERKMGLSEFAAQRIGIPEPSARFLLALFSGELRVYPDTALLVVIRLCNMH